MKFLNLTLLFCISSCAFLKTSKLTQNIEKDIDKVCLNSEGRGRIIINDKKYIFSYESALRVDDQKWIMALSFPIYGEEYIEIDWNTNPVNYSISFESKLLKDQKKLSPQKLDVFLRTWGEFLHEVILLKQKQNSQSDFDWKLSHKELIASRDFKDHRLQISFKNLIKDSYFGRYDVVTRQQSSDNTFKIEVIVRKCLEKTVL